MKTLWRKFFPARPGDRGGSQHVGSVITNNHSIRSFPSELDLISPYSMTGHKVLEKLYVLGLDVEARSIPGDFVECGVWHGGSAAAVCCALRNTERKAWLYDSFMGMPPTAKIDGEVATTYVGRCQGSEEKVWEALRIARFREDHCIVRSGWFEDTFQAPLPQAVSLLHVDCDWYDSVMLTLRIFYDLVSDGGVIVLDDFGHWEGCRVAFYEFAQQRGIKPLLERFGYSQAFWVKGRMHNRAYCGQWDVP